MANPSSIAATNQSDAPWVRLVLFLSFVTVGLGQLAAQTAPASPARGNEIILVEMAGKVEYRKAGATAWTPAKLNQRLNVGDLLKTGENSRSAVRFQDRSVIRQSEFTTIQIKPPPPRATKPVLDLMSGLIYFFSRDKANELQFSSPSSSGAIRGTEFNLFVAEDGRTVLTLIDGAVELTNEFGGVQMTGGQQATAEKGRAPTTTAVLESKSADIIQWCLYYPGVLDVDELDLPIEAQSSLSSSLAAYRSGDLIKAFEASFQSRLPQSDAERVYRAALFLSVGQVDKAEALLSPPPSALNPPPSVHSPQSSKLAGALRLVIAAVKFRPRPSTLNAPPAATATEFLAESYYEQSRFQLVSALPAARAAVAKSPQFGFAWARLAELEFSFGDRREMRGALENALQLSPRHAQALALKGFVLAAENQPQAAFNYFDQAITIDGALGTAWLGRGLVRIRLGQPRDGIQDLLMAAASLPKARESASGESRGSPAGREFSLARSYLGKAFHLLGDFPRAEQELELAKRWDQNDPTPWLYSALVLRDGNRINEAIADLERSSALNDNRKIFRSLLLLDQDRAVRGANLAAVYRDAGLTDVSVREATRAVNSDYANYSAHLFLANSYDALRDPRQVNLRYETPWFNELLLANLLAPVGAGSLSQSVSQQEYSRLFERDRLGLSSGTEYLSNGDWRQYGSQFGTFGNSSYAIDAVYVSQNGQRPNEDVRQLTLYGKFKQQLTPRDSLFFQTIYYDNESGDVRQYYDQGAASRTLRFTEKEEPNLFVGYHREWTPGSHTLLLAGRLDDRVTLADPDAPLLVLAKNADGSIRRGRVEAGFDQRYRSELEAYTAELQHLWQSPRHTLIFGGRFQTGDVETESELHRARTLFPQDLFYDAVGQTNRPIVQANTADLERLSFYGYHHWQILEPLRLFAGVSYDRLEFPRNVDFPPITDGERSEDQVSPKAGFILTLAKDTYLRGSYTRSLGGLYYDTSVRLEPSQIAGFNQAFRSAIPESVAGLVPGSEFETWGVALDHNFGRGTYLGVTGEILDSEADRIRGVIDFITRPAVSASITEDLDYQEKALTVTLNQLIGSEWALGARYRLSEAGLSSRLLEVPTAAYPSAQSDVKGTLHQLLLYVMFSHSSGFFAQAEALWQAQRNRGYPSDLPGDDFWQGNLFAGYRFLQRRAEIGVGLLNLTAQDYQLNPLNLHAELPRERTVAVRAKFTF